MNVNPSVRFSILLLGFQPLNCLPPLRLAIAKNICKVFVPEKVHGVIHEVFLISRIIKRFHAYFLHAIYIDTNSMDVEKLFTFHSSQVVVSEHFDRYILLYGLRTTVNTYSHQTGNYINVFNSKLLSDVYQVPRIGTSDYTVNITLHLLN